ncbi:ribosome recycling factor [Aulographum hederae CBS 113979]|uniref:Ribosome recycling factor n=1 Tax=Aulographum hederae CBS 113979 TaxID=1176131 RepID=A0A6G1HFH4_9PEZI|nr:ribosome recycling factor [Aulographum hederae CBS 113979]
MSGRATLAIAKPLSYRPIGLQSTVTCLQCKQSFRHARIQLQPSLAIDAQMQNVRFFSVALAARKKSGKKIKDIAASDSSPPGPAVAPDTAVDEIFDFSPLESKILEAIEKLTHNLSRLRAGGRFNPETLEALRVSVGKGNTKETFRISDLAQVIPRGRNISVIVGDEEHVQPISTAILASPHSLNPQTPHHDEPKTLVVPIPPATGESRQAAVDAAHKALEMGLLDVKNARQSHQKKLRQMELARRVRPDDLKKAHKQMEDIVKNGNEEVRRIASGAKSVLENA